MMVVAAIMWVVLHRSIFGRYLFAVGKNFGMWHKAWAGRWFPSPTAWENLGGGFL